MLETDMKPVRIFRHIDCEGPGYLADTLAHYSIPFELVRIDAGDTPPPQIDDVSGLVFMGGSMSVNDELPWLVQEMELIRRAVAAKLPVLGHCLGGQLISKALGGTVHANPVKEIGWLPVQKVAGELADDWLADLSEENTLFHWHGETFTLPQGATGILQSRHCAQQGFVLGNTLALQCHVEMTADMVREWVARYADELAAPSVTVQSPETILTGLEQKITGLQAVADGLYRRWLKAVMK